jgi:hypothetical protein
MLMTSLRYRRTRTTLVTLMVFGALLAQGLKVCLHVPQLNDIAPAHSAAIHLESNLTSLADPDDDANDRHVPLAFALSKLGKLSDGLAFIAILTAALLLFLPRQSARIPAPAGAFPPLPDGRCLRPPLRAPPF